MEKTEKITLREALHANARAFVLLYRACPQAFLATACYMTVHALAPYIGIYISAQLINCLSTTRDIAQLRFWVLAALISALALGLLEAVLRGWRNAANEPLYFTCWSIYSKKMLDMDFVSTDQAKTRDDYSQIRQNANWGSWGFQKILQYFEAGIQAVFGILGAVALTVSLFTARVPASSPLALLNHPGFAAGMIAVLAAVSILCPACSNKSSGYWTRYANEAKYGNRFFSFFGFLASDKHRAMDIRIYEQERVCRNYVAQDNSFKPGSRIAQWAKGPMGLLQALSAAISVLFTGTVYLFTCLKAWGGAFGVGSVTQYVGAITALSGNVTSLLSMIGDMRANAMFLRSTFSFLDIPHVMYKGSLSVEKRADRNYEIEFRDVSFRYPGAQAWALRHASMKFRVGERMAIVGRNGSGKTTFIKLLCRLYDPTEGEILLNGIDIRKYDYEEYMSIFSIVFQDFQLLSFTLGQNVAARQDYDRARAEACLRQAGFGGRLDSLPKGLDTCLYRDFEKDGVEISGGEAQKIALARALYKDAPFIVLDEPTAALDPVAESEVYTKFNELVGDKTAIYISHRLSSCRFCDTIAVFDGGAIVQRGTHEQLVSESGKYAELWNAQAQYYQKEE